MEQSSQVVVVQPITGDIECLSRKTFSELEIKERQDIEKWILEKPQEFLGEPLLLISSEFDKFDKSNKRLDVLALDGSGKLVIIELKREVSNSLAELQAIRYAAFCSTMKFNEVVEWRAKYTHTDEATARSEMRDFVDDEDFSDIDDKPRIILAAGAFDDPELTSCVLWLRTFQVDISCVEIAPYALPEGRLILVPRVLIPLPEAEDFIVKTEEKIAEQTVNSAQFAHQKRNSQILARFRELLPEKAPAHAPQSSYMQIASGYGKIHFQWTYRSRPAKLLNVAVHFETPSKKKNRELCEMLQGHHSQIEEAMGENVIFNPDWKQEWAAVSIERLADPWSDALVQWAAEKMVALIKVLQPLLDESCGKEA